MGGNSPHITSHHITSHHITSHHIMQSSPLDANEIVDGLFLGSEQAGESLEQLQQLGIGYVLVPAKTGLVVAHFPEHIVYLQHNVPDVGEFPIGALFREFFDFIDHGRRAGKNVLVHCAQGKSRSACVVIAYLVWKNELSFNDAMHHVRKKRPAVSTKFESLLQRFEKDQKEVFTTPRHKFNTKPMYTNWE